ncbi:5'-methylthioadenosine/S-adenosylhomocysteine nucleosidase [Vibrio breoganii]|uniref:5'-methylthioadenosine/S-adenosylhomocysteine nucleosidase n=1 Tax=Vibrio breoganii TaxID=553239 RepID=UPI000304B5D7|nr:5'-methylthioadenosine/S-adenosylhomocysteine nucleosidase [Vibrio breoganii]OED93269.1 5'-methylthioadenosine nucleosidase [Vibrio breoganii ZF-55]
MFKLIKQALIVMATLTIIPVANASEMKSVSVESHAAPMQPIMIQGPMPIEAEYFASLLTDVRMEQAGNAKFYLGNLNGYPIVVAQTSKGLENTAAATAVGIERYRPRAIISQGTSGGHDPSLQVGDIVLGKRSVNSNNFKTPKLAAGEGSDPMNWIPMDIMASEGSAGEGDTAVDAEKIRYYMGNSELLASANAVKSTYTRGKVVEGTIGSGNFWNNEIDRMTWLHTNFGTSVEEMETSSAAMIADAYGIPFLGVRVLSNNLTNNGKYDPSTAADCQKFVKEIILHYISTL